MDRRQWLQMSGLGVGGFGLQRLLADTPALAAQINNTPAEAVSETNLKITDVKTILTAPSRIRLVVVKVETNQDGLYGLGCATFTQRARAVETAVNHFLRPFLIGKNPLRIEDVWQSNFVSSYWRNGPVLYNAMSGVDMALWDILGKQANMPVYQLLGGKAREAVDVYRHASGRDFQQVEESVRGYMEEGYRHVRVQVAVPGTATYGAGGRRRRGQGEPRRRRPRFWEPGPYARVLPKLFEHLRKTVGDEVELLHDIHERVPPILAMQICKDVEQYRPFFIEDPFSPEDVGYFKHLRQQTTTPIAMGELFNNPNEWVSIISERLIDFIRVHLSQVGGLSMGRKIATLCEFFAVRTAWHGPGDVSPVGHAANVHLDLAVSNFGIQEARNFSQAEQDVFPGCPELRNGYYYANEKPGLGIDINEELAAKFPIRDEPSFDMHWGNLRRLDGSVTKP